MTVNNKNLINAVLADFDYLRKDLKAYNNSTNSKAKNNLKVVLHDMKILKPIIRSLHGSIGTTFNQQFNYIIIYVFNAIREAKKNDTKDFNAYLSCAIKNTVIG